MKPFMTSVAVIALFVLPASPDFAASSGRHQVRFHDGPPAGGYAREVGISRPLISGGAWSTGPIYRHGYYLGTDPDARIREEIVRDKFSGR
jgi:hypothetical protein